VVLKFCRSVYITYVVHDMFPHLNTRGLEYLTTHASLSPIRRGFAPGFVNYKLGKKYVPALDNYEQSCFVKSDLKKMKCVCKTQMMSPPDHRKL
jgi:hypothetical protein